MSESNIVITVYNARTLAHTWARQIVSDAHPADLYTHPLQHAAEQELQYAVATR